MNQKDSDVGEAARRYDDALLALGVDRETIENLHLLPPYKVKLYLWIRDAFANHRDVIEEWLSEEMGRFRKEWNRINKGHGDLGDDFKKRFPDLIRPMLESRLLMSGAMLEYANVTLTSAETRTAFLTEKKERIRWRK